jgi:enediyne biosynthesis protein E5
MSAVPPIASRFCASQRNFGARSLNSALAITGALVTQAACTRLCKLPSFDPRSALITGLSLSLLLRADAAWLHLVAAVIAIGSKFVLRLDGKHIFNPAGFAIVALLLTTNEVWISPGQWGSAVWFAALLCFFAILVLQAARRSDIAISIQIQRMRLIGSIGGMTRGSSRST